QSALRLYGAANATRPSDLALIHSRRASCLRDLEKFPEARKAAQRAVGILRSLEEPQPVALAAALNELGMLQQELGQLGEADRSLAEAIRLTDPHLPQAHEGRASLRHNLASIKADLGEAAAAEALYEEALAVRVLTLGEDHVDTLETLGGLGLLHHQRGQYLVAADELGRVAEGLEATLHGNHPELAEALSNQALSLESLGAFDEAEARHQRALEILRANEVRPVQRATVMVNLASVHQERARYSAAHAELDRAIEALSQQGPTHPTLLRARLNRVSLLGAQGAFLEAEAELDAMAGEDAPLPLRAAVQRARAALYFNLGRFERGREALTEARGLLEEAGQSKSFKAVQLLRVEAALELASGRGEEAEATLREAIRQHIAWQGHDHPETALTRFSLAQTLGRRGAHAAARRELEEVRRVRIQSFGPSHPLVAEALLELYELLDIVGAREAALERFRQAEAILLRDDAIQHTAVEMLLVYSADRRLREGNHAAAVELLRRALTLRIKRVGPQHVGVARLRVTLADAEVRAGRHEEATRLLDWAEGVLKDALPTDDLRRAWVPAVRARLELARGRASEAEPFARQALSCTRAALGPGHLLCAEPLGRLGEVLAAGGRAREAGRYYREQVEVLHAKLGSLFSGLSIEERLQLVGEFRKAVDRWLAFTRDHGLSGSYEVVLQFKGVVSRHRGRERGPGRVDGERGRLLAELARWESRLAALATHPDPASVPRYAERSGEAAQRRAALELELARLDPGGRSGAVELTVPGLAAALAPDEVLIDLVQYEGDYAAFVLRPGQAEAQRFELGSADELDGLLVRFRSAVHGARDLRDAELHAAGRSLRERLAPTLLHALSSETRTLLVSPDGGFGAVPLSVLPLTDEGGARLSDRCLVVYLASAAGLLT
ncbi:MAG: tetratricopeptide repeat protein, partial [Planctomycetota bacterium]